MIGTLPRSVRDGKSWFKGSTPGHPNEPGRWSLLDASGKVALWRRERSDPFPVTIYYILAPTAPTEALHSENAARDRFAALAIG